MEELLKVKDCITQIVKDIGEQRRQLKQKGTAKARAISDYDRKMAVTLATLRNTDNYTLAGQTYKTPPVTILEKIAKGICADECYRREIAESGYKAVITNIQALMAQLNAYQSIYRHLEEA